MTRVEQAILKTQTVLHMTVEATIETQHILKLSVNITRLARGC